MIWCSLEYIIYFTNLAIMGTFCGYTLCCQARDNQFDTKIKVLILMPLFTTFFTAVIAFYYLMTMEAAECMYFGSWIALVVIDLGD